MSGPVHYEIYIRKTAPAPWSLLMATEDRNKAIETAEDLLAEEDQPVSDPEHDDAEAGFAEDVEEEHHDAEIVSLDSFRK